VSDFDFDQPDRFVAGTVGEPGQRTFFLQARSGNRLASVVVEKSQVAALADRLTRLLDTVADQGLAQVPATAPEQLRDNGPLDLPLEEEFRASVLSIVWDDTTETITVEARETDEDADPDDVDDEDDAAKVGGSGMLRVRLTPAAGREFARRAAALVAAGRPPCPFCRQPLDPTGHICPRQNGYLRA
jgi:uncharacterized repeat protein (TIGR03847 family)